MQTVQEKMTDLDNLAKKKFGRYIDPAALREMIGFSQRPQSGGPAAERLARLKEGSSYLLRVIGTKATEIAAEINRQTQDMGRRLESKAIGNGSLLSSHSEISVPQAIIDAAGREIGTFLYVR